MIMLLGFYRRKPGLSWEAFSDHWKNVHGPLLRDSPQTSKYFRRYVQHHIRPNTEFADVEPLEFDGFSEAWFDSADARREMHAQPFWKEVMLPDEALFVDLAATRVSMIDYQVVQIGEPVPIDGRSYQFI